MTSEILALSLEHVQLVLVAIVAAAAIGLPAAVALTRRPAARRWVLGFANIGQTIPSLALFGFLVPVVGIGKGAATLALTLYALLPILRNAATLALTLYALLPILRNTLTGILGVDRAVRESAVAMGMTPGQILRQVELPLAVPSIVAGLRIATVTTIGTATIAAAIGGGGLGVFIFRGIAMFDKTTVLAGALPAAVLAIAADEVLEWIERRLSAV
jgi:osmoprotectant transport system permease protein